MVIEQGDVVWVNFPPPRGSAPAGRHPAVVLQRDSFNQSRINTAVVIAVTSNLKYAALPGNVRLSKGEAGLDKPSVVNVSQVSTIDRRFIVSKSGQLTKRRLLEVWNGLRVVLDPTDEEGAGIG